MLPEQQRARFPYSALADGNQIQVGTSVLTARPTPGHTLRACRMC